MIASRVRLIGFVCVLLCAVAYLAFAGESEAGTGYIDVTTTVDGINLGDGECSLREAVKLARENIFIADCNHTGNPGNHQDIVLLDDGATYVLTAGEGDDLGDLDTQVPGGGKIRIAANTPNAIIDANGVDRVIDADPDGELELSHVTLRNGVATGDPQPQGGAIYNQSTLYLDDVVIENNQATGGGAGIYNTTLGDIYLDRVMVSGNTNTGPGAAAISTGWIAEINDSTIAGNHADDAGGVGGLYYQSASNPSGSYVTITNSTFSSNTGGLVGAIQNGTSVGDSETLSLTNVTISGNSGGQIGALYLFGSSGADSVSIVNTTIAGNANTGALPVATDGIHVGAGQTVTMLNTIVANGAGADAVNCAGTGAITSSGGNLEQDDDCAGLDQATDQHSRDPLLDPLQNNGGLTETHALLANSPAANTGLLAGCPPEDQRGDPRPVGSSCDVGAYESAVLGTFTPTPTISPTPTWTWAPTDTVAPSQTATLTPTMTPPGSETPTDGSTGTPPPGATQGSLDCDSLIEVGDGFQLLLFIADLRGALSPECDIAIGEGAWGGFAWGDVNCDGVVDALDVVAIVLAAAEVELTPAPSGCVPIGSTITRTE